MVAAKKIRLNSFQNTPPGVLIGRGVEIFFYNGKKRKEEKRKGTEKTECKDRSVEWDEDGGTIFFVLRATARCTKRVSI